MWYEAYQGWGRGWSRGWIRRWEDKNAWCHHYCPTKNDKFTRGYCIKVRNGGQYKHFIQIVFALSSDTLLGAAAIELNREDNWKQIQDERDTVAHRHKSICSVAYYVFQEFDIPRTPLFFLSRVPVISVRSGDTQWKKKKVKMKNSVEILTS